MNLIKARLRDRLYQCGLICLAVSLFFFCVPFFVDARDGQAFSFFVGSFAMTWVYFIFLLVNRKKREIENRIHHTFLFLTLFLVSAYSLNRTMSVFEDSVGWFSVWLVISCTNYLVFAFANALPKRAIHGMFFIAGLSWTTFVYLAMYLLPEYVAGAALFFLFGISLHAFVPILFTTYSIFLLNRVAASEKKYWWSFAGGLTTAIAVVLIYAMMWNSNKVKIDYALYNGNARHNGLPTWVNVAEQVPDNFFTRRLLRTELVYSVPDSRFSGLFWGVPMSRGIGEAKKHDPLVMTSEFLSGKMQLDQDDKIRVLRSKYRLQHESQDRLWSGDHLYTTDVNTEVRFWPDCNLAYTEKTITVLNKNANWGRPEEAIYTFYMPEGATVTALSLWINGKEEKGILTTKEKASAAYKSIVGVESRDPSVVQWQEGNSVSVRVFPVLPGESRVFKIGITAPLERVKGKLQYDNVYFDGPFYNNANENILIDFEQPVHDFQLPAAFTSMSNQSYQRSGSYVPSWSMLIKDPGLSHCLFSFDDNTYSLLPYQRKLSPVAFSKIYLDINKSWSREEFDAIIELAKDKDIYVVDSGIKKINTAEKDEIWNDLHSRQFSLFPLFGIKEPEQSLLITKNPVVSPSLDDLAGTAFMDETKSFLANNQRINLFDLGNSLSPYLKSFKELRVFQYDKGDLKDLEDLLQHRYFPDDTENDDQVIIHKSDMIIRKTSGTAPSYGPDHLMRLFAYNHIMQQLGRGQLINRAAEDEVVEEARKAYVVTPVSSLVVLETQKDYDRFDISDDDVSLKNASLNSKGSAPEPHEWAIIILTVLLLAFLMRKNKSRYSA